MPSSTILPPSSSSPSSKLLPTDPDELIQRCTELSFILHHALRLDPGQGVQDHGLEVTIASYLKVTSIDLGPDRGSEGRRAVELDEESSPYDTYFSTTNSLIDALETFLAETLALTSGFRPISAGELDDDSPTTAQDVRDQQALNSERRIELHELQKQLVEQQYGLQESFDNLLALLTRTLQTYPPLLYSHHLTLTLPTLLRELSILLLKFSVLPLRSRTNLSNSHPHLEASLSSLAEALQRRIKRAEKEAEVLEKEFGSYKEAFGGAREAKRFEGLMRELEEIGRERSQVERDLKRLGAGGVGFGERGV